MDGLTVLAIVSAVFVSLYLPIAVWQVSGVFRGWFSPLHRRKGGSRDDRPVVVGRRVAVVICTNGENPDVVEWILSELKGYRAALEFFVIKEERDPFLYSASMLTVPAGYACPNGSRNKMRALHYGTLKLGELGYGPETYLIFLDDDSLVTREYVAQVWRMTDEAGQGLIRLRSYDAHLMSTLADFIRVTDCEVFCRTFNATGRPHVAHGEGLVVRADVAVEIGWDYGTYGAEDLLMALRIRQRGYRFGLIPAYVLVAPPTSRHDFFRQRRRWLFSFLRAHSEIERASPTALAFGVYRYMLGWTGFIGLYLLLIDFALGVQLNWLLFGLSAFNLASYFAAYQFGAASVRSVRHSVVMFLLQFAVAFYEGGTLYWSALRPPSRTSFEVIRKTSGVGSRPGLEARPSLAAGAAPGPHARSALFRRDPIPGVLVPGISLGRPSPAATAMASPGELAPVARTGTDRDPARGPSARTPRVAVEAPIAVPHDSGPVFRPWSPRASH